MSNPVSAKAIIAGIAIGAALALLFAATGSPGLMGVGVAIGATMAMVLNEHNKQ